MPDNEDNDGFQFEGFGTKLKIGPKTFQRILRYVGPHLHWIVRVLAIGILILMICYGASLIR